MEGQRRLSGLFSGNLAAMFLFLVFAFLKPIAHKVGSNVAIVWNIVDILLR